MKPLSGKKHQLLAGRIPVNVYDRCTASNSPHNDRCYMLHGKTSKTLRIVNDGTGVIDIFTHDAIGYMTGVHKSKRTKILWLSEPRELNKKQATLYHLVEQNYGKWFDSGKCNYIITHDQKLLDLDNRFVFILGNGVQIKRPRLYNKTKMTSMIASSKNFAPGHRVRQQLVEKYENSIDIYGIGKNYIQYKEQGLCDYRFSIVVENSDYPTWITEKVLDCFATGTIPVYWGTKNINDYFDSRGIIQLDERFDINLLSAQLYNDMLPYVKNNLDLVREIEQPFDFVFDQFLPQNQILTDSWPWMNK